eukprot:763764-Hanusia_phi.AAC.8
MDEPSELGEDVSICVDSETSQTCYLATAFVQIPSSPTRAAVSAANTSVPLHHVAPRAPWSLSPHRSATCCDSYDWRRGLEGMAET